MIKKFLFFGFIAMMIAGCYPGGAEFVDELDLVLTTHEETYNFGTATTFALPAKIPMVTGSVLEGDEPEYLDQVQADMILEKIRANMVSRGYEEADPEVADLVILPATASSTTLVVYCDYWGGYWDWWYYPGYGGCYYPSGYTYTTGSLVITMMDNDSSTPVVNVWAGVVNGLLQGSDASIEARVEKGIDQAFAQSSYIKTN